MSSRPTSLRAVADLETAPAISPIRRSVSLQRAAADLGCDEATVRRMVGHELEGYRLRGPRSPIRVYVDSIEAHQRRNHIEPVEAAASAYCCQRCLGNLPDAGRIGF